MDIIIQHPPGISWGVRYGMGISWECGRENGHCENANEQVFAASRICLCEDSGLALLQEGGLGLGLGVVSIRVS